MNECKANTYLDKWKLREFITTSPNQKKCWRKFLNLKKVQCQLSNQIFKKELKDGGGIGRGDHFFSYKFIERTIERWTKFTKQLLIPSSGHQATRKAAHCLRREVGQILKIKRETKERGTETRPGKGVLIEEVSNHQETLALAGLGEVFRSRRAT